MKSATPLIWTDVDLEPEARRLLANHPARLHAEPDGSLDGVDEAEAVIVGSRLVGDATFFRRAPRIRVLARCGIGFDRIDVNAATDAGVCAVNTPDAPTESTAEFTITLMLACARRLMTGAVPLAGGHWSQGPALIGSDLAGKCLGLVGCGRIGRRVAEIAHAFRMEICVLDPFAPSLPPNVVRVSALPELLARADFISLHVPSTADTRHLMGAAQFAHCKPGAILINTARGPLVDEAALHQALRSGLLAGAGLDVWDPEPPHADNPLLRLPNVVVTPHMAAFTHEGRRRSHLAATTQVLQVLQDVQPACLLNPAVWPRRRRTQA
jgi:phosphoglycerate dehydrogenase-like enzyme